MGIKASKAGNSKAAKDEYVTAETKAGMVGIGALIGAGIGGAAAFLTGDKAGKALSDATDKGGWLENIGDAIGNFFTDTLPKGWNKF